MGTAVLGDSALMREVASSPPMPGRSMSMRTISVWAERTCSSACSPDSTPWTTQPGNRYWSHCTTLDRSSWKSSTTRIEGGVIALWGLPFMVLNGLSIDGSLDRRQSVPDGELHNVAQAAHSELLHQAAAIRVHRLRGNWDERRDLGAAVSFGDELEDLPLAARKALDRGAGSRPDVEALGDLGADEAPADMHGMDRGDELVGRRFLEQ